MMIGVESIVWFTNNSSPVPHGTLRVRPSKDQARPSSQPPSVRRVLISPLSLTSLFLLLRLTIIAHPAPHRKLTRRAGQHIGARLRAAALEKGMTVTDSVQWSYSGFDLNTYGKRRVLCTRWAIQR